MDSIWTKTTQRTSFDLLSGDAKTDVLIIGGGIAGILCAHRLRKSGVACILAEQGRICDGVTKNTTAKITLQHGVIYDQIWRRYGFDCAQGYLLAQRAALEEYRILCSTFPCDFEEKDSFVYSCRDAEKMEKEAFAMERLGQKAEYCERVNLPLSVKGAVCVKNQGQFHPLKLLLALAKELPIYENTKVLELFPGGAVTNHGKIYAKKIIVATHFPFLNKHGGYFVKLYQHRSYVLALENASDVNGMYVDESGSGLSFRNFSGLLLLGGGGHRTGKQGGAWMDAEEFAKRHYPQAHAVGKWATQDCMTPDGIPYIGRYGKNTPDLYVATGFNKWGMTNAMAGAMILTDLVQGKHNDYQEVFSPQRSILHPQIAMNLGESFLGLVTPTVPRCPHLGCALKYNRAEHSWDCSCHGSRFTGDGKLINNPATGDLKKVPKR